MILTEQEARTKWCPFTRVLSVAQSDVMMNAAMAGANRFPKGWEEQAKCKCIASECMAWAYHDPDHLPNGQPRASEIRRGQCGLARSGEQ